MTEKSQRLNHCVLGGDGGELNYTGNTSWPLWSALPRTSGMAKLS